MIDEKGFDICLTMQACYEDCDFNKALQDRMGQYKADMIGSRWLVTVQDMQRWFKKFCYGFKIGGLLGKKIGLDWPLN